MKHSTASVQFQATDFFQDRTAHALLVSAFYKAYNIALFSNIEHHLKLKMKKRTYCWADKLRTLWASIIVGCNHTVEKRDTRVKLGLAAAKDAQHRRSNGP